jgi:hypothetical protein
MNPRVPINETSPAQSAALRALVPAVDNQVGSEHILDIPCAVTLIDGTIHERAYFTHRARYSEAGEWLNPDLVAEIRESQHRLPIEIARTLYAAGESGMGYLIYKLHFRNQPDLVIVSGSYFIEFPDLPPGYDAQDAMGVTPHEGREDTIKPGSCLRNAPAPVFNFVFHDDPRITNPT